MREPTDRHNTAARLMTSGADSLMIDPCPARPLPSSQPVDRQNFIKSLSFFQGFRFWGPFPTFLLGYYVLMAFFWVPAGMPAGYNTHLYISKFRITKIHLYIRSKARRTKNKIYW